MYNQYIILGDAKPGREQEFDDWYHWVHLREVMEPRIAAIAAQCFRRVADLTPAATGYRQKFLCLYENSDPEAMTGPAGASYDHMLMSSAIDTGVPMGGGYYDTLVQHSKTSSFGQGILAVEWIEAGEQAIDAYIASRFAALLRKSGISSAWLGRASAHQLYAASRPAYLAIYRAAAAAQAGIIWNAIETETSRPQNCDFSASCFTPVYDRVTRMQVLAPDDATRVEIAKARAAVRPPGR